MHSWRPRHLVSLYSAISMRFYALIIKCAFPFAQIFDEYITMLCILQAFVEPASVCSKYHGLLLLVHFLEATRSVQRWD